MTEQQGCTFDACLRMLTRQRLAICSCSLLLRHCFPLLVPKVGVEPT